MKKVLSVIFLLGILTSCEKEKEATIYSEQIQIKNRIAYKANHKEPYTGKVIAIYPTGVLKGELYIKDGKREGVAKSFYPNGQLEEESNFKNGILQGTQKKYYSTGGLQEESNFKNGELDGVKKYYYESGKLYVERVFSNGDLKKEKIFN
ncbi:MAG: toxin-antitoxin system YwqK family antitoxin [Cetobacterium sp.]|uniref:toxin-antitoxin system YwqK family antitoxin n=1 Tax=Cetobacterium sp. TaxID=2071632 RepID=UPI003EE75963